MRTLPLITLALATAFAESSKIPALPYHAVENWAKLPAGWNLGECSGVAVDRNDNVWVFNRGPHPVIEFDRTGKMLQAWSEVPVKSAHGIRVDPQGNIWLIDVAGHKVLKMSAQGRVLMVIGGVGDAPGDQTSKDAFNRPTNVAFAANGDFFVSDGYVNSRVVKFNRDGEYLKQWGSKGTGDNQFNIVHDVVFDSRGRLLVADRENARVQIFDQDGTLLNIWPDLGAAWGLAYSSMEDAVYLADGRNDRVVKLNMEGHITGVLGSHGRIPGKFNYPHSLAIDSTGALYVAEIRNWRVQKFVK
ncbi:MAG: peptidyl-alpha-hydroxyglycine alpha-amidating lyase family protein [Acidobacteriota bacterium]|nr:peptidyl-alpha-hydroxyglycine alpha-amidating lyase family protein [Acidobacteriota bacterium]